MTVGINTTLASMENGYVVFRVCLCVRMSPSYSAAGRPRHQTADVGRPPDLSISSHLLRTASS